MTMISRVLGLFRDHFQAVFFGTGPVATAWEVAYMLPNMLRNLLAEGVLSQSFIPVYSDSLKESQSAANRAAGAIIGFLAVFLTGLVAAGILVFPFVIPLYTDQTPEEATLVVYLSQVMFGFILSVSLTAIFAGIAQTNEHFVVPAFSPILLNLVFITGFLVIGRFDFSAEKNARFLAFVVLGGGFLQLLFQIGYTWWCGWWPEIRLRLKDPALKKIFALMAPAVLGASLFQLNQLIDILLASHLVSVEGAIPGLRFAHRLIQLPTGIIGVALSTAILPALVRSIRNERPPSENAQEFAKATGFSLFLTVPAAIGLFLLGPYIINLLFSGGQWNEESTAVTWHALQFYCLGVPFYSFNKILTSGFYAYQDTKTPVRVLGGTVIINLLINLGLIPVFEHGGLALSTAITSTLNCLILSSLFKRKTGAIPWPYVFKEVLRMVPGWLALAAVVFTWIRFGPVDAAGSVRLNSAIAVGGSIALAVPVYFLVSYLTGLSALTGLVSQIRSKFRR